MESIKGYFRIFRSLHIKRLFCYGEVFQSNGSPLNVEAANGFLKTGGMEKSERK